MNMQHCIEIINSIIQDTRATDDIIDFHLDNPQDMERVMQLVRYCRTNDLAQMSYDAMNYWYRNRIFQKGPHPITYQRKQIILSRFNDEATTATIIVRKLWKYGTGQLNNKRIWNLVEYCRGPDSHVWKPSIKKFWKDLLILDENDSTSESVRAAISLLFLEGPEPMMKTFK